jgi:hypothetical protein
MSQGPQSLTKLLKAETASRRAKASKMQVTDLKFDSLCLFHSMTGRTIVGVHNSDIAIVESHASDDFLVIRGSGVCH